MHLLHIPDFNLIQASLVVLIHVDVDGEMCVDVSHLVLVTLGDTNDQVVDKSADCSESGDILSSTVMQFDVDDLLLWVREVDCEMVEVLDKLAYCFLLDPLLPITPLLECIPRGPSTVTIRDLMVTLTICAKQISECASSLYPKMMPSPISRTLLQGDSWLDQGSNCTHLHRGRSKTRWNECTSF